MIDSDDIVMTIPLTGGGVLHGNGRELELTNGTAAVTCSADVGRFELREQTDFTSLRLTRSRIWPLVADLDAALKKLQQEKFRPEASQEDLSKMQDKLADLQSKIAEMQDKFGDVQEKIGEKQAAFGDQQAKLGEQQAKLGEKQAALGEQQARLSQEATQKMKALIDSAMQQGKARPIQ